MPRRETYEEYTIDGKQLARITDSENPHAWIQSDFVVAIEDRSDSRQIVAARLAIDSFFNQGPVISISDTVAQVAGITGRSSPAPEWWGRRPGRSLGTGEEQPSSLATSDGESHSKATERVSLSRPRWS